MNTWETLTALEGRIDQVRRAVERAVMPVAAKSRELLTVLQQEVEVDRYDMQEKQATFQNGDLDTIEIWRLAMTVSQNTSIGTAAAVNKRAMLTRGAQGWGSTAFSGPLIDVRWNYTIGSRQTRYSRDRFCSPAMLVGLDKGQCLDFRSPLIIPRGEQIEFYVQPTNFAVPDVTGDVTQGTVRFYLQFTAFGIRRSA